tara:strand:- start:310 stop:981 length:672 start_codon:yes stop_codon:yes gene_type:complete
MSTKEWVYRSDDVGLYQEMSFDEHNNNPATIEIENPMDFKIEREEYPSEKVFFTLSAEIPTVCFDELAIAWIKHRDIQARPNKYTLKELLNKGDFKWPISEAELLDRIEDAELPQIVRDRECQEEVPANLEYDNIFDVLTGDKKESENLKDKSDVLIQNRDISELKGMFAPKIHDSVENFKIAALGILEHIKAEQYILDEGALISVIQNALQEAIVDIQIKNL